jgi:hypothetical protein
MSATRRRGVSWGLAPTDGRRPVAAQCQAAVSLTGGSGLSAGTGQRAGRGAWMRGARGPAREGTEVGCPDE